MKREPRASLQADFWPFVVARHRIWHHRAWDQKPWGADEILLNNHFTNVYRELDPGTEFAVKHILDDPNLTDGGRLFSLMLYRKIGKEETWREIGNLEPYAFRHRQLIDPVRRIAKAGGTPYTAAYMVTSHAYMGGADKIENIALLANRLAENWSQLTGDIELSNTREQVWQLLKGQDGWGDFLAFQVLVDATYPKHNRFALKGAGLLRRIPGNHHGWVAPGPGTLRGMRFLWPDMHQSEADKRLARLERSQYQELKDLGMPFLYTPGSGVLTLSRANIANCFCEFGKYWRIKHGTGKARRKYKPRADSEQAEMNFRPEEIE